MEHKLKCRLVGFAGQLLKLFDYFDQMIVFSGIVVNGFEKLLKFVNAVRMEEHVVLLTFAKVEHHKVCKTRNFFRILE